MKGRWTAAAALAAALVAGVLAGAGADTNEVQASLGGSRITPTVVNLRDAGMSPLTAVRERTIPLRRQGPQLPVRAGGGTKPVPADTVQPQTAPNLLVLDLESTGQTEAGGFNPSDVNAAAGTDQIVEATNSYIKVRSKSGPQVCAAGLAAFLRTTLEPVDPRIQFDNLNNRFSFAAIRSGSGGPTATPMMFVATSLTADACGQWYVYNVTFAPTTETPTGSDLDFPNLGQDRNALLFTAVNFTSTGTRIGPLMFSLPKAAVYAGAFLGQPVTFSGGGATAGTLAPVRVAGQPIVPTGAAYFVAAEPGTGYRVYQMLNSHTVRPMVLLLGTISAPFTAPTRQVNQCGTTQTLDPSDGRIAAPAVFAGGQIFFAHGADAGGFPSIMYGAIRVSDNTITRARAFRSGSSDDFNPSISVEQIALDQFEIWLNWAFTDTGARPCQNVSVTVDGARPGQGIPNLVGTGTVLVTGGTSPASDRFGDYSSVVADPQPVSTVCATRSSAVLSQQYFAGGQWRTRIARFCHT